MSEQAAVVLHEAPPANAGQIVTKEQAEQLFLPAMSMELAIRRRQMVVQFTKSLMKEGQDFGTIPGTAKPTLLKPGAEKLCSFFGFEPEFIPLSEILDWTGEQHGGEAFFYYHYRCRLMREARCFGAGEGSCNSWESRYRFRWLPEDRVPEHLDKSKLQKRRGTISEFAFAIQKAETAGQYGKPLEHWQKFQEAIDNGTARKITKQTKNDKALAAWEIGGNEYRIPNPDVADTVNTIMKMAQKRALAAATLIATSASEFFTQDVEDLPEFNSSQPPTDIDTGGHPPGTQAAADYVRDQKLAEMEARGKAHVQETLKAKASPRPPAATRSGNGGQRFADPGPSTHTNDPVPVAAGPVTSPFTADADAASPAVPSPSAQAVPEGTPEVVQKMWGLMRNVGSVCKVFAELKAGIVAAQDTDEKYYGILRNYGMEHSNDCRKVGMRETRMCAWNLLDHIEHCNGCIESARRQVDGAPEELKDAVRESVEELYPDAKVAGQKGIFEGQPV